MNTSERPARKNIVFNPEVFVVGMSRTGTSSIKKALEIIYGGEVYHMSEVISKPSHMKFWSDLIFKQVSPRAVNWRKFFEGYIAITDMPSAYYVEEILRTFPNIKIVLSIRDEDEWLQSYSRLMKAANWFRFFRFLPPLNRLWPFSEQLHKLLFGDEAITKEGIQKDAILAGYREHNRKVLAVVPKDRLLEFNVKEGWSPLCSFLMVEAPGTPFPHRNAGSQGPAKIIASAVGRLSLMPMILVVFSATLAVTILIAMLH